MSANPAAAANFQSEFDRVAKQLPGTPRVLERRRAALAKFTAEGFPSTREESWKYTNLAALARRQHEVATNGSGPGIDIAALAHIRGERWDGGECVFVNGRYHPELSRSDGVGLSVHSLGRLLDGDAAQHEGLRGFADGEVPALVALNAAFVSDGAYIELAADARIDAPLRLLFITTASTSSFPRVVVRAGRGAQARIVESYHGIAGAEGFTNAVTEIFAGEGTRIEHYRMQDQPHKSHHLGHLYIDQARGSTVTSHSLSFGALLARLDIHVQLDAADAAVTLNGLYMANGRQHVDHHTRIDHLQPHTRSDEYYKGVLGGHGRGVFNGKVVVHPGAVKTDAQQSNRNLLLSRDAEVDTKPELEIYADDVKCAHGATVGQLDANALFYLRSRGLDEAAARALLTYAFAGDVVSRVTIERLRGELETRIAGRLPDAARVLEVAA